jgi:phosphoribosylformylglycinamidine cyclo-ligase
LLFVIWDLYWRFSSFFQYSLLLYKYFFSKEEFVSGVTYKKAGVNIEEGEKAVRDIKEKVRSTHNHNVLTDLGSFGGMYLLEKDKYEQPVLVSSTDGVGTKLKIAFLMDKHDTVGEDLVNHCVNDIAVGGAKPLFFLL